MCNSGTQCPDLSVRRNLISKEGKVTFQYGEKASLTCKAGYELKRTKTLTCLLIGKWNDTLPYCEGLYMNLKEKKLKSKNNYRLFLFFQDQNIVMLYRVLADYKVAIHFHVLI